MALTVAIVVAGTEVQAPTVTVTLYVPEAAVVAFLAHPGPALLDVKVNRMELVMPPQVEASQVFGMALYSVKAVLGGRVGDVVELLKSNFME